MSVIEPAFAALPAASAEEQAVVRKVIVRLMGLIFVLTMAMYLDRTNISFVRFQIGEAFGMNETAIAFTTTIFSLGFIFAEIPSNMMLARVGAKIWIPRIAISWGLVTMAMMFVWDATSLYGMRFLLGVAEGGFFPGVFLYLSFWIPESKRARMFSLYLLAQPVALFVGQPLSGFLLDMDGTAGLAGWQWVFVLEGLPSVLLGIFAFFYLTDYPKNARWLSPSEKSALAGILAREERITDPAHGKMWSEIKKPAQLLLAAANFGLPVSLAISALWAPTIIRESMAEGGSYLSTGLVSAIPSLTTLLIMPLWSWHSDRKGERPLHIIVALLAAALGWVLVVFNDTLAADVIGLSLVSTGVFCAQGVFYTYATSLIAPKARPVGIALVSICGVVGAMTAPLLAGYFRDLSGTFTVGLLFAALMLVASAVLVAVLARRSPVPAAA